MAEKILHAFPTMLQATCFFDDKIRNTATGFSHLRMFYDDNLDNRYFVRMISDITSILACRGESYYHVIHHNYDTPELKRVSIELARALPFSMHFPGSLNVTIVPALKVCTCGVKFTGGICSDWCDLVRQ